MDKLLTTIEDLKISLKDTISKRINEFSLIKEASQEAVFKELCFCIMTANCAAEKCMEIHEGMGDSFLKSSQEDITKKFKDLGYRFPNIRAKYIFESRKKMKELYEKLQNTPANNQLREWIVKNIKGIGYKEASHFLRNIGYQDYGIIDFHIIDVLVKNKLIEKPKTITKSKYLEIEAVLKDIAKKVDLTLAELDLVLWFTEVQKILK